MSEETVWDRIKDWWWDWFKRPVKFFWQRRTRGFDDSEIWSLGNTFAEYILPRLIAFKNQGIYGCSDSFYNEKYKGDECREWREAIDKMIFAFEYAANDYFEEEVYEKHVGKYSPVKWSLEWLNREKTTEEKADWKRYFKETKNINNRAQEGFELFGKHFMCLWN